MATIHHEGIETENKEVKEGKQYIYAKGGELYVVKVIEIVIDDQHFGVKMRDNDTGNIIWCGGNFLGFKFDEFKLFDA